MPVNLSSPLAALGNVLWCYAASTSSEQESVETIETEESVETTETEDDAPPCCILKRLSKDGNAKLMQTEIRRMQVWHGCQSVAQEIVTCEFGLSVLHQAAQLGQVAVLNVLLEAGANSNALDDACNTPLHIAAKRGRARAAFLLIQAGANHLLGNGFGKTPAAEAEDFDWDSVSVRRSKGFIRRMFQSGLEAVSWQELPLDESQKASGREE